MVVAHNPALLFLLAFSSLATGWRHRIFGGGGAKLDGVLCLGQAHLVKRYMAVAAAAGLQLCEKDFRRDGLAAAAG